MNHLELLKRAFRITWRYRPLWIFGFLLALCGGGGGGGGGGGNGGNFRLPTGETEGDFNNLPTLPEIDPTTLLLVIAGVFILILLLIVIGIVVRQVTRTALIGMVRQIQETGVVTTKEGWQLGWSRGAWRLFVVNLLVGIPVSLVSIILLLAAFSPLLLLLANKTAFTILGIVVTAIAVLLVIFLLFIIAIVITPFQEMAWRRAVLNERGALDSLKDAFVLVKTRFKDVAILWLLMFGVGLGWGIIALIIVLPVSLLAALLIGGLPAALVYAISQSIAGAAITGIPLALIAIILIISMAGGLYLVFESTVWTLAYLEIQGNGVKKPDTEDKGPGTKNPEPVELPSTATGDVVAAT